MTQLVWDQAGTRTAEIGIDQGVLYLDDGTVVSWSGLTSVNETASRNSKVYYLDGQKYLDYQVPEDYAADLKAFSYPQEFEAVTGVKPYVGELPALGLFIHDQPPSIFSMSYRTMIANDVDDLDHGYRIHVLYNLMAQLTQKAYTAVNDSVAPIEYSWSLTATPDTVADYRSTAHIIFDSTSLSSAKMTIVEDTLYGTDTADPYLPDLQSFITLLTP